jgi:hypothetical protein
MKALITAMGLMVSTQAMSKERNCLKGGESDKGIVRILEFHERVYFCGDDFYSGGYVMRVPGGLLYVTIIRERSLSSAGSIPSVSTSSTFVPYNFRDGK